jgi:hypothetical protein
LVSCVCGIGVLFSVMLGLYWCSLVYLVISVFVDLLGATFSLLSVSHCDSVLR